MTERPTWKQSIHDLFYPPLPWWMWPHKWAVLIGKWWDRRSGRG